MIKRGLLGMFMAAWVAVTAVAPAQAGGKRPARSSDHEDDGARKYSVVYRAASLDNFSILTRALVVTGLQDTLREDGPFTVFAPTDEAFARLGKATLADLFRPQNKEKLADVLKYHVVAGRLLAADLSAQTHPQTVAGKTLTIVVNGKGVAVNDATVIQADLLSRNGVVHAIDRVLTPNQDDVLAVAKKAGKFGTLLAAIKAADLTEALQSDGPFTVLAPTDEAFEKLGARKLKALLEPDNKHLLIEILKYHVVAGSPLSARQVVAAGSAKTLQGQTVESKISDGRLEIGGAKVIATDIPAGNGIIHVIDSVLIPPGK